MSKSSAAFAGRASVQTYSKTLKYTTMTIQYSIPFYLNLNLTNPDYVQSSSEWGTSKYLGKARILPTSVLSNRYQSIVLR